MALTFPGEVTIVDVGPRDGFQNVDKFIDTDRKLAIIDGLVASGVREIEVTSFVNPKAVPQMADAMEVAKTVRERYPKLEAIALVPNLRGAENAVKAGIKSITYVISASEAHNKANVNQTIAESVSKLCNIVREYPDLQICLDIATTFGCPYSGEVPIEDVYNLLDIAVSLNIRQAALCDTIGVADPAQVARLVSEVRNRYPDMKLTMHMHNTRGTALANMMVAAQLGVTRFETSIGGLGGCPFAPGSEGNAATEDAVYMFNRMGVDTGIDLARLLNVVGDVIEHVDAPVTGKMFGVSNSTCENIG